jgi:hypothetical protein
MSELMLPDEVLAISSSSDLEELILFPRELEAVFDRLERIRRNEGLGNSRPTDETIDWAASVLLRVVPSTYLKGASINPFESEIHVTWESEESGKSVIVFFPGSRELKIYHERLADGVVVEHDVVDADTADVSRRLGWFFE